MPGLTKSNEFISRDEGTHTTFAILLYTEYLKNKLSTERVHEIVSDAVNIETEFITEALPCNLIGMNADLMKEYIKFVADWLLSELRVPKLFNVKNPFQFMEAQSMSRMSNFFETTVTEYQHHAAGKSVDDMKFNLNDTF